MSFKADLGKFKQKALDSADRERRAICVELFKSVVMNTPVDTGRARGNWQMSPNVPKSNTTDRLSPSFSTVISQEMNNVGKLGDSVHMTNNLPYIQRLEYGYSGKAPEGMVRKSVERISALIRNRKLTK